MNRPLRVTAAAFLGLLMTASLAPGAKAASLYSSGDNNGSVTVSEPVSDDALVAASTATVSAPVSGEIFAVGSKVQISELGGRSIFAAGSDVTVSKGTAYDAFVAGSNVTLSGTYGHDVYVAGSSVTVSPGTVINGDLRVAGGSVTVGGQIGGSVYASVSTLSFTGGSIAGSLKYDSEEVAAGLDRMTITGATEHTVPVKPNPAREWAVTFLWSALAALALGALLVAFKPKTLDALNKDIRAQWASNFGRGLAVLVVMPVAIMIMLGMMVGWQIAIVLGAAYVAFLVVAGVVGSIVIGRFILEKIGHQESGWLSMIVGVVAVALLISLPGSVGGLVAVLYFFGAMIPAMGALGRFSMRD